MSGTVDLRDRIARSKFIPEAELDRIKALAQEIDSSIHQILAQGGELDGSH